MAGLPNSSNALQQWHHLFEAEGAKRSPQAQQHLQQLLRTGLPTRKHENWKYTPLEGLTNSQFVCIAGEISPQQRDALALTLDAVRLVFVDGRYVVLVDGAQAVMHHPVDVQALDCDFYVFSGHKLYGPTGIGILYVKEALLQEMPPWEGGGSMIATVSLSEGTTWTKAPWRFEAGTPNTGGIIGLGAALEYVSALGLNNIAEYEQNLMHYALSQLESVPDLTLYGPQNRLGVIAFNLGKHHAYDVGSFLDNYGIAVRTGHHCAMPLMAYYNVPAMCRASLAMYNTHEEVDRLVTGLQRIHRLLG